MYALLGAFPIIFQDRHKMGTAKSSLPFLSLVIGEIFGGLFVLSV
jgi:DHA1 family multidrug resistance protein-like MFS transporter